MPRVTAEKVKKYKKMITKRNQNNTLENMSQLGI